MSFIFQAGIALSLKTFVLHDIVGITVPYYDLRMSIYYYNKSHMNSLYSQNTFYTFTEHGDLVVKESEKFKS